MASIALAQSPFRPPLLPPGADTGPRLIGPALRASNPEAVAATVNGVAITHGDLLALLSAAPPGSEFRAVDEAYPALLDLAIGRRLLLQAGRAAGLDQDPAFLAALRLREDLIIGEEYLAGAVMARATGAARREGYAAFRAEAPVPQEFHLREILTRDEASARQALDAVTVGLDFAEAARRWSIDPSAPRGGDVGFVLAEDVEPILAQAAAALSRGEVSPTPVKTALGWYLLKLEESRPSKRLTYAEDRGEIALQVAAAARLEAMEALRREARIERFDWNGQPPR